MLPTTLKIIKIVTQQSTYLSSKEQKQTSREEKEKGKTQIYNFKPEANLKFLTASNKTNVEGSKFQ